MEPGIGVQILRQMLDLPNVALRLKTCVLSVQMEGQTITILRTYSDG
jgi:hypothetical protein